MDDILKNILPSDEITIDSSPNLNNEVSSDGTSYLVRIWDREGLGNSLRNIDYHIDSEATIGTLHTVGYKSETRKVRVFPCLINHITIAFFYD